MNAEQFTRLAEYLAGKPVKDVTETDRKILNGLLSDDERPIGHSQLNELLLLVNKDRMEWPFFEYFFGTPCTVGALAEGVRRFQITAMLRYGNFIHAYRTLARAASLSSLKEELGEWAVVPDARS